MTPERLQELRRRGWRLTRDGSTATAIYRWLDPDEEDSGWELLVLLTAGHPAKFSLEPFGAGLSERGRPDAVRLREALDDALELLERWRGELPPEDEA